MYSEVLRVKGKMSKYLKRKFKKKRKYKQISQDEVDSARPFVSEDKGVREETDTSSQRSYAIHTSTDGDSNDLFGFASEFDNASSVGTECERESMSSVDLLDMKQQNRSYRSMMSSPDSAIEANYTTDSSGEECALCNAKNTEYMVQVFMSTLERNLNVNEILPHLHYISHNDARTLSQTVPQEQAVRNLLDIIVNKVSPQEGKWTTFLAALSKTGYEYLRQLLTGETEKDHYYTNEILKIMKPGLINEIHLSEIIDLLIERGLVNEEDQGEIESAEKTKGPIAGTRIMLEKIDKRSPNWDTEFADALEKAGLAKIASVFKMVEHHEYCPAKDHNPKIERQGHKNIKRKFKNAKRHICRQSASQAAEPKIKRKRTTETPSDFPASSYKDPSQTSEPTALVLQVDELRQNIVEVKTMCNAIEEIPTMQKELMTKMTKMDEDMTALMKYLSKSSEEQSMLKQQIEDQNQTMKYLTQTVSSLITPHEDLMEL